jgi:hypothetical protein
LAAKFSIAWETSVVASAALKEALLNEEVADDSAKS